MFFEALRVLVAVALGFLFAYLYGFIEHGYIPPAEHLRLKFFDHFAIYHIIMFGLFSAVPLVVLVFETNLVGLLLCFGLWAFLPLGEDVAWYHFAGTWPTPQDWTSWGGGYHLGHRWVPRWYLINSMLAALFFTIAFTLALAKPG
jgi:hypothetical protein